jgi:transcriptional antiterminator Rof (Rho-off)
MRAAGPVSKDIGNGQGLQSLISELSKRKNVKYIQLQKEGISLTLQSNNKQ